MDELLADFLTETSESLGELDTALVTLERNPGDRDTLALVFRLVHTVKGTCGFLGLPRLERVAHAAENVLGRLRDNQLAVAPAIISHVLAALDAIKDIVATLSATGAEPAGGDTALIAMLDAIASGDLPTETVAAEPVRPPEQRPKAPVVKAPVVETPAAENHAAENHAVDTPAAGQTIRVGVDVLEELMTLVSELVLTRNQLLQRARTTDSAALSAPLQRLSHITTELQEGVMKTRMQPVGNAWNKLPRLVRDLARDLNKQVGLVMLGADTELDRQVIELIKDPLTHMVRNSADHGLETPAERRAAGKPETGRITLNAFHEGGHIIIEIGDDGRGLALDRVRAKAVQRGLATEAELAAMGTAQIQRFIFHAGFSTAAAVTAVSGRGVGMDVVKTNIEKIGGTIDLRSTEGSGSTFTLKIPLTLAIVSALIVEAGGERFAIPQTSVIELVRPRDGAGDGPRIEHINETPVLRLRDQLLPLVGLAALLRLDGAPATPTIVVAQIGASTLGIIVDRVFDTEEIVVKPVAPILRHIALFGGNTILGDGSVIMILDPNGIARAIGLGATARTPTLHADAVEGDREPILIFRAGDDVPKAVPLGLVARLEDMPRERIERSAGGMVTQYRGRLMPLVALAGVTLADIATADMTAGEPTQPVLVFTEGERSMGLVVDEIIDLVEDRIVVELAADRPGLLGTAIIAGRATEILDTAHWLTSGRQDFFAEAPHAVSQSPGRLLVVEDSDFFRQMLVPVLATAGYRVTAAENAGRALALREAGRDFDAIISDIEMPEMDGLAFARHVREEGPWSALPLIALSGRAAVADEQAGRAAGFTDYVAKFDRTALLQSLRECLANAAVAA